MAHDKKDYEVKCRITSIKHSRLAMCNYIHASTQYTYHKCQTCYVSAVLLNMLWCSVCLYNGMYV